MNDKNVRIDEGAVIQLQKSIKYYSSQNIHHIIMTYFTENACIIYS